jgi:aspartyl-tRNA(Asn)/glutamyl-tRNA(Gln) amidotransferase subunit A
VTALDPEVRHAATREARTFRDLGCRLETVAPRWPSPFECWYEIFFGGLTARLLPYRGRADDIEPGLRAIIDRTAASPPGRYVQAWFDRLAWWQHPRALFERYDLLLTPTVACPPFALGLDFPGEVAGKPIAPSGWIPYTYPFNLTGQPAASVPCGFTRDGLPIGLQIVGRRFDDATVLRAAAAFERERPWANARPGL